MIEYLISQIAGLLRVARDDYRVNPVVFLVIYLACVPVFYYSLFRTFQSLAKKLGKEVMLWSAVFLCANIAPFIYVIFFGRNIPWWVYGIIAILIGQGVLSLIMKLRKNPADDLNMNKKLDEE
jgi:hypothetical protein